MKGKNIMKRLAALAMSAALAVSLIPAVPVWAEENSTATAQAEQKKVESAIPKIKDINISQTEFNIATADGVKAVVTAEMDGDYDYSIKGKMTVIFGRDDSHCFEVNLTPKEDNPKIFKGNLELKKDGCLPGIYEIKFISYEDENNSNIFKWDKYSNLHPIPSVLRDKKITMISNKGEAVFGQKGSGEGVEPEQAPELKVKSIQVTSPASINGGTLDIVNPDTSQEYGQLKVTIVGGEPGAELTGLQVGIQGPNKIVNGVTQEKHWSSFVLNPFLNVEFKGPTFDGEGKVSVDVPISFISEQVYIQSGEYCPYDVWMQYNNNDKAYENHMVLYESNAENDVKINVKNDREDTDAPTLKSLKITPSVTSAGVIDVEAVIDYKAAEVTWVWIGLGETDEIIVDDNNILKNADGSATFNGSYFVSDEAYNGTYDVEVDLADKAYNHRTYKNHPREDNVEEFAFPEDCDSVLTVVGCAEGKPADNPGNSGGNNNSSSGSGSGGGSSSGTGSGTGTKPSDTKPSETPTTPTNPGTPTTPATPDQPSPTPSVPKNPTKGSTVKDSKSKAVYKVTQTGKGTKTVQYTKPQNSKAKSITVPSTVKVNGVTYKVTSVAANAFKNNNKVTKITIGSNVTTIGKNAFSGCTKLATVSLGKNVTTIGSKAFSGTKGLKTIVIRSPKLTSKSLSKSAFSGISTKTVIKVPKSKVDTYKKLFVKRGLNKKVKIKAI